MKELFMKCGPKRLFKPSRHQLTMAVGLVVLMALFNGCASDPFVYNIKSKSEIKGDKKVLAGRFTCFDNEAPVHCLKSGFLIHFNKEGEPEAKLFTPDDAGYVYIAVTEGYYNIATFAKEVKDGKGITLNLDPFPVILVQSEDSVVNFGTFELRFSQSAGRAQLRVNYIRNYDVTRSEIASRLGKFAGSISDGSVQFLQRARK